MGTNFNYDDTSHQLIFDNINGGAGSGALQEVSQQWRKLGNEIGVTGKSYVQSAISSILANREGAAAQAAIAATGAMLPWMDEVMQIAAATAHRTQEQADYWVTAKNSVPPVPPTPKSIGFFSDPGEWVAEKMDWFPGVTSEPEKAEQRQQDAAEQARQAMRVYQASSNPNLDSAPAFTMPQALEGSVGSLPLTAANAGATGAPPAVAGGGAPVHFMSTHQPVAPTAAVHPPAAHQSAAHRPASNPPAATVSQLAQGGPAKAAGNAASPERWVSNSAPHQSILPSALAASTGLGSTTTARQASVPAAARLAGVGRNGHHAAFGPRPSAEFGPRPTAGPSSMDETSGARGGASPAGMTRNVGGAGYGQPFIGTAGQRNEQDREHRSKYLLHDDSNSIVGDLPPTAPPVIGADY